MDGSPNKEYEATTSPTSPSALSIKTLPKTENSPTNRKTERTKLKGGLSFDEEELKILSRDTGSAATANFAMGTSDDTKPIVPQAQIHPEAGAVAEEEDDEEESGSRDATASSENTTDSEPKTDSASVFESLEKPEILDAREESVSEDKLKHLISDRRIPANTSKVVSSEDVPKKKPSAEMKKPTAMKSTATGVTKSPVQTVSHTTGKPAEIKKPDQQKKLPSPAIPSSPAIKKRADSAQPSKVSLRKSPSVVKSEPLQTAAAGKIADAERAKGNLKMSKTAAVASPKRRGMSAKSSSLRGHPKPKAVETAKTSSLRQLAPKEDRTMEDTSFLTRPKVEQAREKARKVPYNVDGKKGTSKRIPSKSRQLSTKAASKSDSTRQTSQKAAPQLSSMRQAPQPVSPKVESTREVSLRAEPNMKPAREVSQRMEPNLKSAREISQRMEPSMKSAREMSQRTEPSMKSAREISQKIGPKLGSTKEASQRMEPSLRSPSEVSQKSSPMDESSVEVSLKSVPTAMTEPPCEPKSPKESPSMVSTTSHEISARRSASLSAIGAVRSEEPPKHHYKFMHVRVDVVGKFLDANFTENLVLAFLTITSPLFYHLVIGDQIIDIDGLVPKNLAEFLELVDSATGEVTLGVIRAWNVRPPTPTRMSAIWSVKKYNYVIVELPLISNMRPGYEFSSNQGRLYLASVEPRTMAAFSFIPEDRVVDVDSVPIPSRVNVTALKNRIRAVQERDGFCTIFLERPISLHNITNPSCVAMKSAAETSDVVMADDAAEIGCREACKYLYVKNRNLRNPSVYGPKRQPSILTQDSLLKTAEENDSEVFALTPRKRGSKKRKRMLKIGKNPKEKAIPSDVKQGTPLNKASESSLRKLMTRFISKIR